MRPAVVATVAPVAIVVAVLAGCSVGQPEFVGQIEEATELDGSSGRPLVLADVTQFEWDVLHVFGPGTPGEEIVDALGFAWRDGDVRGPGSEDDQLIVFVRERRVVGAAVMDRCRPDFVDAGGVAEGLRPSEARFELDRRGACWRARPLGAEGPG